MNKEEIEEAIKLCEKAIPKDIADNDQGWHGYIDKELYILRENIMVVIQAYKEAKTIADKYDKLVEKIKTEVERRKNAISYKAINEIFSELLEEVEHE
jgi:tetratricopeptide (TPR) repeat protein